MKNKFLKLDNPCSENWNKMQPNDKGSYCDSCSKNVIDFTKLNQLEISELIKNSNNKMCARLTSSQLNTPILDLDSNFEFNIPKSSIAASLMLASSFTIGQNLINEEPNIRTEFVQNSDLTLNSKRVSYSPKQEESTPNETIIFKGKVISEDLKKSVVKAKITLVTSQEILSAYTSKDGTFSIEIPKSLIDNDNVIRVTYSDIEEDREDKMFFGYETRDYILSKKELANPYTIKAKPEVLYLGGIVGYYESKPVVLSNGREIKYREFEKAQQGKKSSCSLENKDFMYFHSEFAIAIYGDKAKDGLYILTDKE